MDPFQKLESEIDEYLLLEDRMIVRLLCATVTANRMPQLDPTWLFVISNSSGGKSELLSAMSYANGCWEQDNLTSKTFISGATRGGVETSLLHRLPKTSPILVFKDLTLLLDKDPKETAEIFSQLRLIYDGKLTASFGTGEDIKAEIHMGLIAGTTTAIEDTSAKQASMGQRAIRYVMKQPGRKEVTRRIMKSRNEKGMRTKMGEAFKYYLDKVVVVPKEIPDLPDETIEDIVNLADMATSARSSVKRKEYDRNNRIERKDLPEMPGRMAKQLKNLGHAMMAMNNGPLLPIDNKILYQLALDSIPSGRKEVMMAATRYSKVDLKSLAVDLKLPDDSVKIHLDDLIALDIMVKEKGFYSSFTYHLRQDFRELIAKFENIEMTNNVLQEETPLPIEDAGIPIEQAGNVLY